MEPSASTDAAPVQPIVTDPTPNEKRGCLLPLACLTGFISFRFWSVLMQPDDTFNSGDPFAIILLLFMLPFYLGFLCIAVAVSIAFLWSIVGLIKPDWVMNGKQ